MHKYSYPLVAIIVLGCLMVEASAQSMRYSLSETRETPGENVHKSQWYDYLLKGQANAFSGKNPVRIFVMGKNEWRDEADWPLARAKAAKYFLHSAGRANGAAGNGQLSAQAPATEPKDSFIYDPAKPVPTVGGPLCCDWGLCTLAPLFEFWAKSGGEGEPAPMHSVPHHCLDVAASAAVLLAATCRYGPNPPLWHFPTPVAQLCHLASAGGLWRACPGQSRGLYRGGR